MTNPPQRAGGRVDTHRGGSAFVELIDDAETIEPITIDIWLDDRGHIKTRVKAPARFRVATQEQVRRLNERA